jgi:hypothetical protein
MLARISKYRTLQLSYCMVSGAILFFLLTQFLTGHWVIKTGKGGDLHG